MRVGTVCFAIRRGIGYLAKSFYDHGLITDVATIAHGSIKEESEWYPQRLQIVSRPFLSEKLKEMIRAMDCMLFIETPFDWSIVSFAKSVGVRTVLLTMYECTPNKIPVEPDLYLCPSALDMLYFPLDKSIELPLPVDPNVFQWRLREAACEFVHHGGYLGLQGREGTNTLIDALPYIQSPISLLITSQKPIDPNHQRMMAADSRVRYVQGTMPAEDLYSQADVAVGAQIWNGCSVPLQEAFASGLLVMNTDRFPMNSWLPKEPLIPVARYERTHAARGFFEIDKAIVNPQDIAKTIDYWYGRNISYYSNLGKQWADAHSWEALLPKYQEVLHG